MRKLSIVAGLSALLLLSACDSAPEPANTADAPIAPALGHPRVWLQIDEKGYVDCGYCDKRFILEGGPADESASTL